MSFRLLLARERGMCAGVERAILVVEKALERYGAGKVFVLHEVVHNRHVVEDLKSLEQLSSTVWMKYLSMPC